MEATEIIRCRGHPLVSARHPTTFEITTDRDLTEKGDCIIGIRADKGASGLSGEFRQILCHDDAVLVTILLCGGFSVKVLAKGSSELTLDHPSDLVWRKSGYICGRTVGIRSDTAAADLPEGIIRSLRDGNEMIVTMNATRPGSGL